MALDRSSIVRTDFPLARRGGYDRATVDAHLDHLAQEVAALRSGTLGATTSSRVGGILDAAEASAAEIERQAWEDAARVQAAADESLTVARERVRALGEAAALVQARLTELTADVNVLQHTLGAPEEPVQSELFADDGQDAGGDTVAFDPLGEEPVEADPQTPEPTVQEPTAQVAELPASARFSREEEAETHDVEAARLVALNMAMSGQSREATDHYIAQRYAIEDRARLLDEVYASVGA
jgi:hypothetical protein